MNRLKQLSISLMILWPFSVSQASQVKNVLLILADDMGPHLSVLGTKEVDTPNIDMLAKQGVVFTNAHASTSSCSPSRTSILTGMYPHSNGHWRNTATPKIQAAAVQFTSEATITDKVGVHSHITTLPEILKAQGFYTGITQKWHLSPASKFPFSKRIMAYGSAKQIGDDISSFFHDVGKTPFFLQLNINNTHRPFNITETSIRPSKISVPELLPDVDIVRRDLADYFAAVNEVDNVVYIALDQLKKSGNLDNTLIIFTSDHGWPYHRAKASSYFKGTHVPLILAGAGINKNSLHQTQLVGLIDLMPTILDYLNLSIPNTVQGKSLKPLLQGDSTQWRKYLYTEHTAHGPGKGSYYPSRSIFDGQFHYTINLLPDKEYLLPKDLTDGINWKNQVHQAVLDSKNDFPTAFKALQDTIKRPEEELYDIHSDPYSLRNLSGRTDYKQTKDLLAKQLLKQMIKTDDKFTF